MVALPSGAIDGGPTLDGLQTGEKVIVTSSKLLSRSGREDIKFRVVGDRSFGWGEAAVAWGGEVEAITHRQKDNHNLHHLFKLPKSTSVAKALSSLPTAECWNGIMLCTIASLLDADDGAQLFRHWQPLIAIVAVPSSLSRKCREAFIRRFQASSGDYYSRRDIHCSHSDIGGVTSSRWHFYHFSRTQEMGDTSKQAVMMAPQFSRHLQTALDDTIGDSKWKNAQFDKVHSTEPLFNSTCHITGYVSSKSGVFERSPVYSSDHLAPDVGSLTRDERMIWVYANSVYSKPGEKLARQIVPSELFSIWDYEGKYESSEWTPFSTKSILSRRLESPPGKMLRSLVFTAGETLLHRMHPPHPQVESLPPGLSSDVPFSPLLEEAASTRVKAAQADDAQVDLSQWAEPDETEEVAQARDVLRRLAVKWWKSHQEAVAYKWLQDIGPTATQEDIEAVNDCMRRVKGCTYWSWERGSRIMFYKFPPEWRNDFRDGVKWWRLTTPPKGYMRNVKAPSREAELLTRLKIFKLKVKYYLDRSKLDLDTMPTLLTPRFTVNKIVLDDGTVKDVRCVWDCTVNGLNATLYQPGFMMPSASDAEDQVVKWLSVKVGEYLSSGSPPTDYTSQDASS